MWGAQQVYWDSLLLSVYMESTQDPSLKYFMVPWQNTQDVALSIGKVSQNHWVGRYLGKHQKGAFEYFCQTRA